LQLCVTSCPTEALPGEGKLDSRRCISYQTIENRNQIPEAIRPFLADMVFGCDICQEVCPLNYKPVNADERFRPRAVTALSVQ